METQSRITLAAGMVKDVADVKKVLSLPISEITAGSYTLPMKEGNPGKVFHTDGSGNYWNSIGLKNVGMTENLKVLPEMYKLVRDAGRTFIVSASGNSPEENKSIMEGVMPFANAIELNLACPNIVLDGGERKPLIGYSVAAVITHMAALGSISKYMPIRLKMPPYTDFELLKSVAEVVWRHRKSGMLNVTHIIATNTLPNCLPLLDDGSTAISVGYAGGSGEQLHALAVGNVKKWRELLPSDAGIAVIGVGGVREAKHALNFERFGVAGCQMASAYYHEGEKAFNHVLQGLMLNN